MESPEHWFEDFGSAKLARGRTTVKLDANFAKVIKRGDYRVFVTPEGDCHGLYVRRKSANGFEVRELMGGKSSIAFSYRIVGRRKDIKGHRRFAKIDMTPAAANQAGARHRAARADGGGTACVRRPRGEGGGGAGTEGLGESQSTYAHKPRATTHGAFVGIPLVKKK